MFRIFWSCMASIMVLVLSVCLVHATDRLAPKVMLGMAIDKDGGIVASDPLIEYVLPNIDKRIDVQDIGKWAKYLPPLSVNHEDLITHKNGESSQQQHLCGKSIQELFETALEKYSGKDNVVQDNVLLVAKRVIPESRPLICVWWFTYVPKEKLKPIDEDK